ncbi:valine--pyruvate transaminase [Sessilibacter sp. MAH1]
MKLSQFGERFCAESGTYNLMDDLGKALTTNPEMLFLGGGNPAQIPEIEQEIQQALETLVKKTGGVGRLCSNYQSPQGDPSFLKALAAYLNKHCDLSISEKNIAITNGSQAAFFVLFNMFAGEFANQQKKHILLPLTPEYIGYSGAGLSEDFFRSCKPVIEHLPGNLFKYQLDEPVIEQHITSCLEDSTNTVGALCVSRPNNPSSNVIADEQIEFLTKLAKQYDVPLIIDGAYGLPFPGILFNDAKISFTDNTILVLSLSKLGLPGARTGIVIANPEVIQAFAIANTSINLAPSSLGPALAQTWFETDKIHHLCHHIIQPFYRSACDSALGLVKSACADFPVHIHIPEGAFFLWLWCQDLPISSQELYQRLKDRGVLVLSGHHFFLGVEEDWPHKHQCIRLSYCQPAAVIEQACEIIRQELKKAYEGN